MCRNRFSLAGAGQRRPRMRQSSNDQLSIAILHARIAAVANTLRGNGGLAVGKPVAVFDLPAILFEHGRQILLIELRRAAALPGARMPRTQRRAPTNGTSQPRRSRSRRSGSLPRIGCASTPSSMRLLRVAAELPGLAGDRRAHGEVVVLAILLPVEVAAAAIVAPSETQMCASIGQCVRGASALRARPARPALPAFRARAPARTRSDAAYGRAQSMRRTRIARNARTRAHELEPLDRLEQDLVLARPSCGPAPRPCALRPSARRPTALRRGARRFRRRAASRRPCAAASSASSRWPRRYCTQPRLSMIAGSPGLSVERLLDQVERFGFCGRCGRRACSRARSSRSASSGLSSSTRRRSRTAAST